MDKDIVPKEGNRFNSRFDSMTSKEAESPVTFRSTEITAHEYLDFSLFRLVPPHLVDPGIIVVKTMRQPSVLEEHNYHKRPIIKTLVRKRLYWLRPPSLTFADSDQSQNNESSTESAKKFREEVAAEERPRAESASQNVGADSTACMTTRPSAAIDDNESYLDEQGLRWQRLFAVPDNDLSTLLRICIEFGGGTAQNWSNGNKCIVFGCAFAQQKNADALCPFRLIYVPERRTIYGQIEHKHAHLFAEAINNTINDRKAKEERKEEQQKKIREKEVEYEQKQSEGEKEAEEEVIGDGQGEMGEQREEGREKAIREDQPNGGEKEAKEEVMGDGQRKMGEQREEGREKVVENGYQPNGGEKEAKEEVIGDGQQQSGDEAEKQRELRKIAAEKGTITANEQRQLISNQIVIENAIASSSNAAHSFTDHLDKSWHWLANVREECELKQLCTQKCLKFPVDLEWDKLFFASSSDAIVRLRCNFWQRHRKMCGGSGPSAVVHPPCNYYAIFVPSSGAVLHKFPHNHPQEKENTQKLGVDCFVAKHSDQQHVDFDRMLNWWLPDGWLVLAHLQNLSDFVGLCLRHTLRQVQPNDHHHLRFWHALQSSSSTQMDKNFGTDYIAHLECIFNNVENSSALQVPQKTTTTASLRCPFRALFSRRRQTVYCSAVGHNHPVICHNGAAQLRKKKDFTPQPPIKLERSEFDDEKEISPCFRQQQLAPASVARPFHNKSLRVGRALADARALECAGMSHKRAEVWVSVGTFKRMMRKAEKNLKVKKGEMTNAEHRQMSQLKWQQKACD